MIKIFLSSVKRKRRFKIAPFVMNKLYSWILDENSD